MKPLTSVPSRTEQVYSAIRESICDCSLEPGTHLVQEDLAAMLGVSRQPIQQAMLLLKNDGLVVEHGARGLHVAPIDRAETVDRYQIRLMLDKLSVRQVAERARSDDGFKSQLRREGDEILKSGKIALGTGTAADAVRHDVEFHSLFYHLSGNSMVFLTAEPHWYFLRRVMVAVLMHADRGTIVWDQHKEILDAAVAGDVERVDALASDHITGAQNALFAALETSLETNSFFSFRS